MSGEVSEKSWATGGCLAGWRTADEGQRNAECKVRKGLKGEDEARGKIKKKKKVDMSGLPKVLRRFVRDKREGWHERDEVRGVCGRRKARGGY